MQTLPNLDLTATVALVTALAVFAASFTKSAVDMCRMSLTTASPAVFPPLAVFFGMLFLALLIVASGFVPMPFWAQLGALIALGGFLAAERAIGQTSLHSNAAERRALAAPLENMTDVAAQSPLVVQLDGPTPRRSVAARQDARPAPNEVVRGVPALDPQTGEVRT